LNIIKDVKKLAVIMYRENMDKATAFMQLAKGSDYAEHNIDYNTAQDKFTTYTNQAVVNINSIMKVTNKITDNLHLLNEERSKLEEKGLTLDKDLALIRASLSYLNRDPLVADKEEELISQAIYSYLYKKG
jgi:hypothetical protein